MSRYEATGSQAEFEPGSDDRVLQNHLGISDPAEMDHVELLLLEQLYLAVFEEEFPDRRLAVTDLRRWHHQWLGNVYPWAGEQRTVNLSKGSFHFASVAQIPRLLDDFQKRCLDRFTPAHEMEGKSLSEAIAITHVELVLIHPYREGNGRLARLLADVMSVQAGYDLLDYQGWDQEKDLYFAAIQQGLSGDYREMIGLVRAALSG
ncbi:MAG: Fic family protein [Gammaproteobacteria bacterium]|nr:Fic family protein [Gammaproteobacteria bacterium]